MLVCVLSCFSCVQHIETIDCSPPGSSVRGILQARVLDWVAISGGSSRPKDRTQVSRRCSWMKDAWPVKAQALGGRHYRGDAVDQNLDPYSIEYTYPDGT